MIKSLTCFSLFGLFLLFNACNIADNAGKIIFVEDSNEWFKEGRASWKFDGDQLVGTSLGGSGFVMTNKKYQNFTLSLEFYPDAGINSGIFVRCKNKEISNKECYEMNIWDYHPDQESRTGSIVTRAKPLIDVQTIGKWNSYKITCESNHIRTWINGKLTADIYNDDLSEGYIALQATEPGRIKFRNVKIKEF
ncbi:MAG: DUF1080 domain-containing protein [Eudoraea sp.]|uniref:3-keto-disaccharide hydrolase n=1 Tax=Eudoraea sp. TaxID=1979955 RepID=UPI003C747DD9